MKTYKRVLLAVFLALALAVSIVSVASAEVKIGYVNLGKTFDEYEETKEYDKQLEKKGDAKQKERQKMVDEIRDLKDEIALMSEKGRMQKQLAIDEKIASLQEFDKEARDELKQERDSMVRDILREINKVIQEYGREHGYTVILNDRLLVYGDETIDITQDIIDTLNANYNNKKKK